MFAMPAAQDELTVIIQSFLKNLEVALTLPPTLAKFSTPEAGLLPSMSVENLGITLSDSMHTHFTGEAPRMYFKTLARKLSAAVNATNLAYAAPLPGSRWVVALMANILTDSKIDLELIFLWLSYHIGVTYINNDPALLARYYELPLFDADAEPDLRQSCFRNYFIFTTGFSKIARPELNTLPKLISEHRSPRYDAVRAIEMYCPDYNIIYAGQCLHAPSFLQLFSFYLILSDPANPQHAQYQLAGGSHERMLERLDFMPYKLKFADRFYEYFKTTMSL